MQLGIIILILFLIMQVPFSRSSLNHDDVFVLDTESKIYQFNGATSNIQERAKALDVVQYIKDKYHEGKCEVAVSGKLFTYFVIFNSFIKIKYSNSLLDSRLYLQTHFIYHTFLFRNKRGWKAWIRS